MVEHGPAAHEGKVLWEPSEERRSRANITRYIQWLAERRGLSFASYQELWAWSVEDLEGFWSSIWEYFGVEAPTSFSSVLASRDMPGAQWFPGPNLNFAQHALRRRDGTIAILS